MDDLLRLLLAALSITLVDVDNAVYAADRIGALEKRQRLALFLSTGIEFAGRLVLLALFAVLTTEQEPLFTLFGIDFSLETIALFTAGAYLLISNGRALIDIFTGHEEESGEPVNPNQSLAPFLLQTSMVLILLSVDTVLVISNSVSAVSVALFLLIFSAAVRLLFIDRLVYFIEKYPAFKVFVTILLLTIGVELIAQGLGYDAEAIFNLLLVIAMLVFIAIVRRGKKRS